MEITLVLLLLFACVAATASLIDPSIPFNRRIWREVTKESTPPPVSARPTSSRKGVLHGRLVPAEPDYTELLPMIYPNTDDNEAVEKSLPYDFPSFKFGALITVQSEEKVGNRPTKRRPLPNKQLHKKRLRIIEAVHSPKSNDGSLISWEKLDKIDRALRNDVEALRDAMGDWGTNEAVIVAVTTRRTFQERQRMVRFYYQKFNRNLLHDFRVKLTGDLERIVVDLYQPREEFLASELKAAMTGFGRDEETINGILCCLTAAERQRVAKAYQELFKKYLEDDIVVTSGSYSQLLVTLATLNRFEDDDDEYTVDFLKKIVDKLNPALPPGLKQKQMELTSYSDESTFFFDMEAFIDFFAGAPFRLIKSVAKEFEARVGKELEEVVAAATKGGLKNLFADTLNYSMNRTNYFAHKLHDELERKVGANGEALTLTMVTQSESELQKIRRRYRNLFRKRLERTVAEKTRGLYRSLVMALLKAQGFDKSFINVTRE